jgi:anaerobic magnesium-protoporphyrin IX monomethyl ester cyclase
MRVTLVNPPLDTVLAHGHVSPVTAYLFYNSAPLGILYIAAVLEQAGHVVHVIDAAAERYDVAGTVAAIGRTHPDVVGIGSTTVVFETTKLLGRAIKDAAPHLPVVLGGYHVTLLPEECMATGLFDVGVLGEGEHTMLDLCSAFEGLKPFEDVQGIVFDTPLGLHFTPARPRFKDLDKLPFPARHLLPPDIYKPIPIDEHASPKFSMITSRGCPHACAFCQKSKSGYRSHSPGYIADEVEHLVRDFGARDIAFVDSLFCASKKRVQGIMDEFKRRDIASKTSWTCSSRVEVVDRELLQAMKDAGCWRTRFGIESGSDRVLDFISKGITKEKIRAAITAAHEVGLRPKAFFIVGHMPDTAETIQETIDFAKTIPLHDVTVQINTLLPKTPQMEIWEREGSKWGRLVNESTDEKSFWEPTFVPWGLEPADLIAFHRKFYREFYFRPITMARHLETVQTWRDVYKYAQASNLFSFLFYNSEKPSLNMLKTAFGMAEADETG